MNNTQVDDYKIQVDNCDDVLLSMRLIAENLKEVTEKLALEDIKAMLRKILQGKESL